MSTLNKILASDCLNLCSSMCVCVCVLDSSPAQCRCAVDSFISGGSGLLREWGRGKGGRRRVREKGCFCNDFAVCSGFFPHSYPRIIHSRAKILDTYLPHYVTTSQFPLRYSTSSATFLTRCCVCVMFGANWSFETSRELHVRVDLD